MSASGSRAEDDSYLSGVKGSGFRVWGLGLGVLGPEGGDPMILGLMGLNCYRY